VNDLAYELGADEGPPVVGQVLEVEYFQLQWQTLKVEVQRVIPQATLQPPAWRVWGVDQYSRGVAVYVHGPVPGRAERAAAA